MNTSSVSLHTTFKKCSLVSCDSYRAAAFPRGADGRVAVERKRLSLCLFPCRGSRKQLLFFIFTRGVIPLLFCLLKPVKYCILLKVDWENQTWMSDEEEQEGDDKGMVHLEVVWVEGVLYFYFYFLPLTDVSYWHFFFLIWKYSKQDGKKNKLWYWIVVYHS